MFGISDPKDLLLIEDVSLVKQLCTPVTVEFDDVSVADHFDEQFDLGRTPEACGRVWLHTHPESCPRPSSKDEETFDRVFSTPDWAVMFIVARGGATYARMRTNVGPGCVKRLGVEIDFDTEFPESDREQWEAEYDSAVTVYDPFQARPRTPRHDPMDWREEMGWADSEWVAS